MNAIEEIAKMTHPVALAIRWMIRSATPAAASALSVALIAVVGPAAAWLVMNAREMRRYYSVLQMVQSVLHVPCTHSS